MVMSVIDASTRVLLHGEDLRDSSSRHGITQQRSASDPVISSGASYKFGSRSLDIYGSSLAGIYFEDAWFMADNVCMTIEGWVYLRSMPGAERHFFGGWKTLTALGFGLIHTADGKFALYYADNNNNNNQIVSTTTIPLNEWVHVAGCCDFLRLRRLFVNGVLEASSSAVVTDFIPVARGPFYIGTRSPSGAPRAKAADALVDEVRYVSNICLYNSDFTPPTAPYTDQPRLNDLAYAAQPGRVLSMPIVQGVYPKEIALPGAVRDTYYGGRGRVAGTVKEKGTPDMPVRRKVWLLDERSGFVARELWSHPATGAYSFDNIDESRKYTVISFDYEHDLRAVIADNITPSLMS